MRYFSACAALLLAAEAPLSMAGELPDDAVHLGCRLESNGVSTPASVVFSEKLQALRWDSAWWDASVGPERIVIRPTSSEARVHFRSAFSITIDRRTGRLHLKSAEGESVWGICKTAASTSRAKKPPRTDS